MDLSSLKKSQAILHSVHSRFQEVISKEIRNQDALSYITLFHACFSRGCVIIMIFQKGVKNKAAGYSLNKTINQIVGTKLP